MQLSIIIPTLNDHPSLLKLLHQLKTAQPAKTEIIIVDGGSDQRLSPDEQMNTTYLTTKPGRAQQMNTGAQHATGDYLFFLHADSILLPNFTKQLLTYIQSTHINWGFCSIKLTGKNLLFRWISFFMNVRSRLSKISTGDQGLLIERPFFEKINRFPDIALMEDIAICKKLKARYRPNILPFTIHTSSRRWQQHGIFKTIILMWWLRFLFFIGVSPAKLVKKYYP